MAINFPNSPAVNDTFTVGGINFTFTGVKWESGAVVELSSDTTPTLGGNLDGGAKNINNVGVITSTGFSGPLTGNVTGNATGLTGDPSIQVTNATVLGNLDVQGTTSTIDTAITQVDSLAVEGSVGIGTTNPGTKLDVFGGVRSNNDSENFQVYASNGFTRGILQVSPSGTGLDIKSTYNDAGYISASTINGGTPYERLRITSGGLVGIGTNNPTGNLHIGTGSGQSPANSAKNIVIDGSGAVGMGILFGTSANTAYGNIYWGNSTDGNSDGRITYFGSTYAVAGDRQSMVFRTSGSEKLRITSGGNVEVGDFGGSLGGTKIGFDGYITLKRPTGSNGSFPIFGGSIQGGSETSRINADGTATFGGTVSDSIGPLRRLGITGMSGDYTLVASDAGKQVRSDGAHVLTLPNNVFETGDMITVTAHSAGAITINQGSGMTLYNAADGSSGNVTLAARTVCTIFYAEGGSSSKAYIAGGGIS